MRKNNDGYVIIYVIFVILFLCIVAIGTCSSALSNLQSQNEAVVQMQERYAAEGEIEVLVANMCGNISYLVSGNGEKDPETAADEQINTLFGHQFAVDTNQNRIACSFTAGTTSTVNAEVEFVYTVNRIETGEEIIYQKDADGNEITDANGDKIEENRIPLYDYTVSVTTRYLSYTTGGDAA